MRECVTFIINFEQYLHCTVLKQNTTKGNRILDFFPLICFI